MLYRWTLFGYVQRLPKKTPAQIAIEIFHEDNDSYGKFRERHSIVSTLSDDLKKYNILHHALNEQNYSEFFIPQSLTTRKDIDILRLLAAVQVGSI